MTYDEAKHEARHTPSYSLGEEVGTTYGRGIIVSANMIFNGLYIEPKRASYVVWFGMESTRQGFVSMTFGIDELSKLI
jgi:hypothetical protein